MKTRNIGYIFEFLELETADWKNRTFIINKRNFSENNVIQIFLFSKFEMIKVMTSEGGKLYL